MRPARELPVIVDRYLANKEVAIHGNPEAGPGARIAALTGLRPGLGADRLTVCPGRFHLMAVAELGRLSVASMVSRRAGQALAELMWSLLVGPGDDWAGADVISAYCYIEGAESSGYARKPVAWTGRLTTRPVTRGSRGFLGSADRGPTPTRRRQGQRNCGPGRSTTRRFAPPTTGPARQTRTVAKQTPDRITRQTPRRIATQTPGRITTQTPDRITMRIARQNVPAGRAWTPRIVRRQTRSTSVQSAPPTYSTATNTVAGTGMGPVNPARPSSRRTGMTRRSLTPHSMSRGNLASRLSCRIGTTGGSASVPVTAWKSRLSSCLAATCGQPGQKRAAPE